MDKNSNRPKPDNLAESIDGMNMVMANDTTGALPALLTEEQLAEVFDDVFRIGDADEDEEEMFE